MVWFKCATAHSLKLHGIPFIIVHEKASILLKYSFQMTTTHLYYIKFYTWVPYHILSVHVFSNLVFLTYYLVIRIGSICVVFNIFFIETLPIWSFLHFFINFWSYLVTKINIITLRDALHKESSQSWGRNGEKVHVMWLIHILKDHERTNHTRWILARLTTYLTPRVQRL